MGFFDRSRSKNSATSVNDNSQNIARENVFDSGIVTGGGVKNNTFRNTYNVTKTDHGAVSGGLAVAMRALDSNTAVSNTAITSNTYLADSLTAKMKATSDAAIAAANKAASSAISAANKTATNAMFVTQANANRAISSAEKTTEDALYFYDRLSSEGFDYAEGVQHSMAASYGEALAFVDSANRSEASRLTEQSIKYGTIAVGTISALWILAKFGVLKI